MKLEIFVESPEYQGVTSEILIFSSEYTELQNTSQQEIPPYSIEILLSPPLFDEVNDTILQNLLQKRIEKDTAWAIAGGLPDKEKRMPLLGSWTFFQKGTATEYMKKPKIEDFPTIAKSLEYPVWKIYLHYLVDIIEVLELPYIFVQAYEQVSARILHIILKHRDLYSKIIPIMGAFHLMRIFQSVLFKPYICLGLQDWLMIPEQFLLDQLVIRLKRDIITVQCTYIRKALMLLFREEKRYHK